MSACISLEHVCLKFAADGSAVYWFTEWGGNIFS